MAFKNYVLMVIKVSNNFVTRAYIGIHKTFHLGSLLVIAPTSNRGSLCWVSYKTCQAPRGTSSHIHH